MNKRAVSIDLQPRDSRLRRKIYIRRIFTLLLVALVLYGVYASNGRSEIFDRNGLTPQSTARTLVHDRKWGMRAKKHAIKYGDEVIPHIESESKDFTLLDNHNSFWLAEVLGSIDSKLARETLADLYLRKELTLRLVASIGLGMQEMPPDIEKDGSFLVDAVKNRTALFGTRPGISITPEVSVSSSDGQLAIIALGYSKNIRALDQLHSVLEEKPSGYWNHAYACRALARLHFEEESVPVLRHCLENPEFYALPDAFRALVCLGDKEAIPLAINRVGKELEGKNSAFIIDELSRVTGKFYVYDKKKWSQWWESVEDSWQIPEQFLVEWDAQPERY